MNNTASWMGIPVQSNHYRPRGSREDDIHMPIWYIRIQANALRGMQRTRNIPTMYDGHILGYG